MPPTPLATPDPSAPSAAAAAPSAAPATSAAGTAAAAVNALDIGVPIRGLSAPSAINMPNHPGITAYELNAPPATLPSDKLDTWEVSPPSPVVAKAEEDPPRSSESPDVSELGAARLC